MVTSKGKCTSVRHVVCVCVREFTLLIKQANNISGSVYDTHATTRERRIKLQLKIFSCVKLCTSNVYITFHTCKFQAITKVACQPLTIIMPTTTITPGSTVVIVKESQIFNITR